MNPYARLIIAFTASHMRLGRAGQEYAPREL